MYGLTAKPIITEEALDRRTANIPSIRNQHAVAASIRAKVKPPSTSANDEQLMKTEHPNNNDAIYDGRPDSLTGPSITIYHPIFAEFQQCLHDMPKPGDIPLEDVRAASLFISTSAQYFKTESDRQNALRPAVMHFLHGQTVGCPRVQSRVCLMFGARSLHMSRPEVIPRPIALRRPFAHPRVYPKYIGQ